MHRVLLWLVIAGALVALDDSGLGANAAEVEVNQLGEEAVDLGEGAQEGAGFPGPFSPSAPPAAIGTGGYSMAMNYYNDLDTTTSGLDCGGTGTDSGFSHSYGDGRTIIDMHQNEDNDGEVPNLRDCRLKCNSCVGCVGWIDMMSEGNCYFMSQLSYTLVGHMDAIRDMDKYTKYWNKVKTYEACDPGESTDGTIDGAYSGRASLCTACQPGFYQTKMSMSEFCQGCPEGRIAVSDFTQCTVCEAGKHSDQAHTSCLTCNQGSWSKEEASVCQVCPKGTYDPGSVGDAGLTGQNNAATECLNCPAGQIAAAAGSTICTNCGAGEFSSTERSWQCQKCDPGEYAGEAALSTCRDCLAGKSTQGLSVTESAATGQQAQEGWGAKTCIECPRGRYSVADRASECELCVRGQYGEDTDATGCKDCVGGQYTNLVELSTCEDCTAGRYSADGQNFVFPNACDACDVGKYSLQGEADCTDCPVGTALNITGRGNACDSCGYSEAIGAAGPVGTYQDEVGQLECKICLAGHYQDQQQRSGCKTCPAGYTQMSNQETSCDACQKGQFQDETTQTGCKECTAGQYEDAYNSDGCKDCDAGKFTVGVGMEECEVCIAGKYSDESTGATGCTPCSTGKHSGGTVAACEDCAVGKYTPTTGRSDCFFCSAGFYAGEGAATCSACPSGFAQSNEGEEDCTACAHGKYAVQDTDAGTAECKLCSAGTKSTESTSSTETAACEDCEAGKYSGKGQYCDPCGSACTDCQAGYYANAAVKATACSGCAPGQYQDEVEQTDCKDCGAGTYKDTTGADDCGDCPAGYHSDPATNSVQECTACKTNYFAPQSSSTICKACPAGHVAEPSSTGCTGCPTGRTSTGGDVADPGGEEYLGETIGIDLMALCESCVAGKYAGPGGACVDCLVGKFSSSTAAACDNCNAGRYTDSQGQTSCTLCPGGYYSQQTNPSTAISSCQPCTAGQYQAEDGKEGCSVCAATFSSSDGSSACTVCDQGKTSTSGGSCADCPSGEYAPSAGTCSSCPGGHYQDGQGQTLCKACPNGFIHHSNFHSCVACDAGTVPSATQHACEQCVHPDYSEQGDTACSTCPSGKYHSTMESQNCPIENGFCVKSNGHDQNSGVTPINHNDGDTDSAQQACLEECQATPGATGCEVIWNQSNRGCYVHTQAVDRGNGVGQHMCWVFSECTTIYGSRRLLSTTTSGTTTGTGDGCASCPSGQSYDPTVDACEICGANQYQDTADCPIENGFCVKSNGHDQNSGVTKIDSLDGDTDSAQQACLEKCQDQVEYPGATGCEVIWNQSNRGCYVHTQAVDRGNGVGKHMCWVFSDCDTDTSCANCAAGQVHNSDKSACQSCPSGFVRPDTEPQGTCRTCPNGQVPTSNLDGCEYCTTAGYIGTGTTCDAANPGTKHVGSSPGLFEDCPLGEYQDEEAQSVCKSCSSGKYADVAGSTGCKHCPSGWAPQDASGNQVTSGGASCFAPLPVCGVQATTDDASDWCVEKYGDFTDMDPDQFTTSGLFPGREERDCDSSSHSSPSASNCPVYGSNSGVYLLTSNEDESVCRAKCAAGAAGTTGLPEGGCYAFLYHEGPEGKSCKFFGADWCSLKRYYIPMSADGSQKNAINTLYQKANPAVCDAEYGCSDCKCQNSAWSTTMGNSGSCNCETTFPIASSGWADTSVSQNTRVGNEYAKTYCINWAAGDASNNDQEMYEATGCEIHHEMCNGNFYDLGATRRRRNDNDCSATTGVGDGASEQADSANCMEDNSSGADGSAEQTTESETEMNKVNNYDTSGRRRRTDDLSSACEQVCHHKFRRRSKGKRSACNRGCKQYEEGPHTRRRRRGSTDTAIGGCRKPSDGGRGQLWISKGNSSFCSS